MNSKLGFMRSTWITLWSIWDRIYLRVLMRVKIPF